MSAINPRQGGRYIRDPETGDVVKQGAPQKPPKAPGPKAKDK
jgi:hypothetical protein